MKLIGNTYSKTEYIRKLRVLTQLKVKLKWNKAKSSYVWNKPNWLEMLGHTLARLKQKIKNEGK